MADAPWSLLLVKITSALDAIVGVAGLTVVVLGADVPDVVLGADVPDGALIAVGTFLAATVTGILGWALVTLWNLSQLVARMSEQVGDHERRLGEAGA